MYLTEGHSKQKGQHERVTEGRMAEGQRAGGVARMGCSREGVRDRGNVGQIVGCCNLFGSYSE